MKDSKEIAARYLLGEMTEDERAAFEEGYFGDPRIFAEVADVEHALVDDYVRGRLSPDVHTRVEKTYLSDPRRRERVRFAEALAVHVDRGERSSTNAASPPRPSRASWKAWLLALTGPTPAVRLALASAIVVAIVGGFVWFRLGTIRSREESTRAAVTTAPDAPGAPANRTAPGAPPVAPIAPVPARVATLALAVGPGVRGIETDTPPTLIIPPGTTEVRLVLTLRERDYSTYRVLLRAVGGAEILRRADLKPVADPSGPAITLALPASPFRTGDYMLTLQGATSGGEFDDLSQSLFRVDER